MPNSHLMYILITRKSIYLSKIRQRAPMKKGLINQTGDRAGRRILGGIQPLADRGRRLVGCVREGMERFLA